MFETVKTAIQAVEQAENNFESVSASNATAQKALLDATTTANNAASDLAASKVTVKAALDALTAAITDFESSL